MRIALLACCALLALPLHAADPNDGTTPSAAELEARRGDLASLRQRIERLRRDIAETESERRDAADELRQSERAISALRREQRKLLRERREIEARLRRLEGEHRDSSRQIAAQSERVGDLLRRQLRWGDVEPIRLALSGLPPAEVSRNRRLLTRIAQARIELADDTRRTLARTRALTAETRAQHERLQQLAERQRSRQQALEREKREHRTVLKRIGRELSKQRSTVGKLRRDEGRLSDLVHKLGQLLGGPAGAAPSKRPAPSAAYASYDRRTRFAQNRGSLTPPVRGTGVRRSSELKGLFFPAANGSEVAAVAAGQVVFADWLRGFGNLLVIDHGENYLSIYGNNEALLAEVGDRVTGGEAIATAGSSGGQSESGLYFELRFRGEAIDPAAWLRRP